jgi:hypothetical protein
MLIAYRVRDQAVPRTAGLLLIVCLVMLAAAVPARAVPVVTPTCTLPPATAAQDCSSWFRANVGLHWTVTPATAATIGCQDQLFSAETSGTVVSCSADDGTGPATAQVTIKLDRTPPVVTGAQAARGADVNGWYNRPVSIDFSGTDGTSGLADCPSSVTYGGPDSATVSVALTCSDRAGNTSDPFPFALKYDETPPQLTGSPERPPDHAGWFTHSVRFLLDVSDATSGLADCPASVTYAGPDDEDASVTARCRDQAGNVSRRTFTLKYDATPPPIVRFQATPGDARVALRWQTSADAASAELLRIPGLGPQPSSVVYEGRADSFVDGRVVNGVGYTYRLRLSDRAGNDSSRTLTAVPRRPAPDGPQPPPMQPAPRPAVGRLLFPRPNAVLRHPPRLRWTRVRGARYYNVQLYRGVRKVLSRWPRRPRYQVKQRWSFDGKRRRLAPGLYRWYVWPGYGPRAKGRYGAMLGQRSFRLRR